MSNVASPWNSLEIAKLAADFAIPVTLLILSLIVSRFEKRIEQKLDQEEFGRSWKKEIYDEVALDLNLIYCAFNYVGRWRECTPENIITSKRRLDEKIFAYSPILSPDTIEAYNNLMNVSFETGRGRGTTLLIRSNVDMFAESAIAWKEEYRDFFVPMDRRIRRIEFNTYYEKFRQTLFRDFGFLD